MNKTLKIYLFSFILLIVLMVAIDQSRTKPLDWRPSFQLADKIPLGLYVLNQEIDKIMNDSVTRYAKSPYEYFEAKDSLKKSTEKEVYLFIQDYYYIDENSTNLLLKAVEKGNTAFISSDGFTSDLIDTLSTEATYKYFDTAFDYQSTNELSRQDTVKLTLANPQWEAKEYNLAPVYGQVPFSKIDTTTTKILGYMIYPDGTKYIGFIKIKYGEGTIYLHNQPSVFTNYSLLSQGNLQEYAEHALSYVPENYHIVWFVKDQTEPEGAKSSLSIIFKYPALRMLWLVFIYGLVLFIFFTAKRKQRVIPIVKPLRNTTVEFAQTIGNLYFQEGDTSNISQKKIIYFLDRIRQTYYIDTKSLDDTFVQRLHLKSGKELQNIRYIVNLINGILKSGECSEPKLVALNDYIEKFWDSKPSQNITK